ncbi:MAG: OmpA family protein [Prevotella sp.]|jgi:outer membrane protein OmpA-like peptidoglycan-associated protein|nr:OmpA family protein [Prevotella sp.]
MNTKKLLMSGLLFLGVLSAHAQDGQQQGTTEYDVIPHWYVQIQPLGAQHTLGEIDFSDLLSYNVQAALGYNFNKILGARLSVNAWQSKAGIDNKSFRLAGDGAFKGKWSWKYVAPSLELTANLSNLAFGVNPNRLFTLTAFVGVGANIGFGNDDAEKVKNDYEKFCYGNNTIPAGDHNQNMDYLWDGSKVRVTGRGGLMGDFRINDKISIGLEVNANVLNDRYNSKKAGNADWYFNALAGVKINLGETYTERTVAPVIEYVDREVEKRVEVQVPGPQVVIEKRAPLRRDIFFKINSWKIQKSEIQKVADIAFYLDQNPEAKVVMVGYADKGTGNATINARLAANRAQSVKDTLVKEYNISESRITYDSKGDTEQPFAENDKNRVTICIAE